MANYERSPKGQVRRPSRPEHVVAFEFLKTYYDHDNSDDGAIQKSDVYEEYQIYCEQHGHKPLLAADFGRVLKSVFPNSRDRRLGSRGSSKYCYVGVKRRDSLHSPMPASRPQEPVTDAELCHAYEVVICEWASTVLSRRMSSLQELATYLLGQRFVQTRSCSALTIMSAHKESIDRLHLEVPLNKHRETQLKLQEKLMQRMAQRRELLLLPSSSSPGSTAGDVTAATSPAAFSPATALRDGLASGSSSPLHHAMPALATRTNTAPSSCRSTPVPPSSCESSARSTPMGGLTNDVFHPSSAATPTSSAAALLSMQLRPADARYGHGSTGSGSLAEAFASAWADSNCAGGGGAPPSGRWAAAGCERRPWPSAALVSAAAAAVSASSCGGGGGSSGAAGYRLMVRSEPCTPTPWQRSSSFADRLDDPASSALLLLRGDRLAFPSSAEPFGQASSHAGFQPVRLNAWPGGGDRSGGYVESCPGSAVGSPVAAAAAPGTLAYDLATVEVDDAGITDDVAMPEVFEPSGAGEDSLMGHFLTKANDDGTAACHGQLPVAADSHSTVGSGSNGSICSELASATAAGLPYVCGAGLSPDAAAAAAGGCGGGVGCSSFYGLFDTRHASAFVPVGRALAKAPGGAELGLSCDTATADNTCSSRSSEPLGEAHKETDYCADPAASLAGAAAHDAEPVVGGGSGSCAHDISSSGTDGLCLLSSTASSSGEHVGLTGGGGGGDLHSTDEDFADLLSIIDGSMQQESRTTGGDLLQPWQQQQQQHEALAPAHDVYQCPPAAAAAVNTSGLPQQPQHFLPAAGQRTAPSLSAAASAFQAQLATTRSSLPRDQRSMRASAAAAASGTRPLQISIKYPSGSVLAPTCDPSQPTLFSRQMSCVQVKSTDTPPVTPTGNFRPVITPNSELRRWCNGGAGWPGMHGGTLAADGEGCSTPASLPLPPSSADTEKGAYCGGYQGPTGFGPSGAMSPPLHPPKKRKHLSGDASLASSAAAAGHRIFATGLATMQQPSFVADHETARQLLADGGAAGGGGGGSRGSRACTLRDLLLAGPGPRAAATLATAAKASSATTIGGSTGVVMEGMLRFGAGGHDFAARRNLTEALLSPPCDLMASGGHAPPLHNASSQSNGSRAGASSSLSMPTPPSSKASTPDRFA